ncbi:MAG TPA: site-specific integrase [Acidimicrobiales bacterium]|jgi:integrase|nr:site-specific integrase [Acidimicrobiales bacterium]
MAEPRELSPGVFSLRAYVGRSPSGSPRYLSETYRHPRPDGGIAEARRRLRKLEQKAAKQKSTISFAALLNDWLDHTRTIGRSPTTVAGYEWRCRLISEALGDVVADTLTAKQLDQWYGQLLREGRSPADVRGFHRVISAALNRGEQWGTISKNVARRADPPRVPAPEISPPSADRVATLIGLAECSRSTELADLIRWAVLTGCRRGEICALRWSRVDWENARVRVSRSIWQVNKDIGEKDTKGQAARWVSVGEVGLTILRGRQERARAIAEAVGVTVGPDAYVWSSDESGLEPMHPDRLTQGFTRLCRTAEKPAAKLAKEAGRELSEDERWNYRLHDCRHFAATALIEGGMSLVAVSKILGHAQVSTTGNVYGHGNIEGDQRASDILGATLALPS